MIPQLKPVYRNLRYRTILAGDYGARNLLQNGEEGVWYDPSDLTTMFQDAAGTTAAVVGQPVGKILDKSGNGNHATQSTDLSRPVLRQSGDKYYLEFDGVDDGLEITGLVPSTLALGAVWSSFWGIKWSAGTTTVFGSSTATGARYMLAAGPTGSTDLRSDSGNPTVRVNQVSVPAGATPRGTMYDQLTAGSTPKVMTLGGNNLDLYTTGIFFGKYAGFTFNGNLYSLIIRGKNTTNEEVTNAEQYVNSKTGAY